MCLQSPFRDLNAGPLHYQCSALPTELKGHTGIKCGLFEKLIVFRSRTQIYLVATRKRKLF